MAPPTPVPGASLVGLPPAISINPRDLAREAGVPLSGIDWSNLNDGKQFSECLLVLRLKCGRGKTTTELKEGSAECAGA